VNKNAVYGDASALSPGGVRLGAPAMTSRGLTEADFVRIAELLHKGTPFLLLLLLLSIVAIAIPIVILVFLSSSPSAILMASLFPCAGAQIAIAIQNKTGKLLKNYLPALETSEEVKVRTSKRTPPGDDSLWGANTTMIANLSLSLFLNVPLQALKEEVEAFASTFPMPGYENH
jgi:hypothetical protein